jgi:hypothetical protein
VVAYSFAMSESAVLATEFPQQPPDDSPPVGRQLRTRGLTVAVGAGSGVIALILRESGVLVGITALAVVGLCVIFAPGPRRCSDRVLLLAALALGWLPLLGWLPGIEVRTDVPGILLAIAVGVVCGYQFGARRRRPRTMELPTVADGIALGLGAAVTLWWARPFARLSYSGILQALFGMGWDHAAHFDMYRENLLLGSFVQVRSGLPGGLHRLGYDYPQGMHQAWAQFTRLTTPHPPTTIVWQLHTYVDLVMLTAGGVVALGCMAVSRLAARDVFAALPAMAVIVATVGLGSFTAAYAISNYTLAIVATGVAVSLMLRPTLTSKWNFFAVAGMGLIVVYNWFPLILLMAPALAVSSVRLSKESHGRWRLVSNGLIGLTAIAYVLPAVSFAHRGVSWLNIGGSWFVPPWGLLIISMAALAVTSYVRQKAHPDLTTNAILGAPAVLGAVAVCAIVGYTTWSTGSVTYYAEKICSGVFGICLVLLACVFASEVSLSKFRRSLSLPVAVILAVILAMAALQVDGYIGPFPNDLRSSANAVGIGIHDALRALPSRSLEAQQLLLLSQRTSGRGGFWCFIDPRPFPGDKRPGDLISVNTELADEWFDALRGDPSSESYASCNLINGQLQARISPAATARILVREYPRPIAANIHLVVPWWLDRAMVAANPIWRTPGQLVVIPVFWQPRPMHPAHLQDESP